MRTQGARNPTIQGYRGDNMGVIYGNNGKGNGSNYLGFRQLVLHGSSEGLESQRFPANLHGYHH